MKISVKLYLLIGGLLLLAGASGAMGLYGMKVSVSGLEDVYHKNVLPLRDLKDISDAYAVDIVGIANQVRDGELSGIEGLDRVQKAEQLIAEKWQAYHATEMGEAERQLADQIDQRIEKANATVAQLKVLLEKMDVDELPGFVARQMHFEIDPVTEQLSQLVSLQLDGARQRYEASAATFAEIRNQVIALVLLGLLAGFGAAAWVIRRSVQEPLRQTQAAAREMAAGNLARPIAQDRRDEMGILLASLEEMRSGLQRMVRDLKSNADEVSASAEQLSSHSTQVATATEQQSQAAATMAAAVQQLTVSVNHVAANAEEAHGFTRQSGQQSQAGHRIIDATVAEMQTLSTTMADAAQTIAAMGEHSQGISRVVQVIRDVAEQTNLLALNAAIEAARAGEQGRGFAVVADEVRKLAERTSQATTEIGAMIGTVQSSAQDAVRSMEQAVERVAQGVELARQASESIQGISAGSQQAVQIVNEISNALQEQSMASNELAANVEKIARMSEDNSATSRAAAVTANRLEELATNTRQAVASFRID